VLVPFSSWCPKVISQIGRLPDTLADRCILIRLQRKEQGETCAKFRELDTRTHTLTLRRKCARLVLDQGGRIASARPEIPEALNDRAGDIWEPLLAIADLAGGEWPEKARAAAMGLTLGAQESCPITTLLLDIIAVFATEKAEKLFSRTLVGKLNSLGNRPWVEQRYWINAAGQKMRSKIPESDILTEQMLAQKLKAYGVRSKAIRIGETVAKGYVQSEIGSLLRRYVPMNELRPYLSGQKEEET